VPIKVARILRLSSRPARVGHGVALAAFLIVFGSNGLQNAVAEGDTRTISFHHIHTDEDLTITYKVNGQYDEEALKKIDYELRDWRRNEVIHMDPHLIDLLWEVRRDVGAKEPIWVVCGYRSPETNAMLRQRSSGVAKFSQHTLGKATDFYIPGVPLEQLRAVGLYLQRGGVGFYPTSGSPFVHLDTGNVRHWPSIAADQMPRLMAEGRDLAAVAEAADVGNRPRPVAVANVSTARSTVPARPDAPGAAANALAAAPAERTAAARAPAAKPKAPARIELASAESRPVQLRPGQATGLLTSPALSANEIINQRDDYWRGLQGPDAAPAPQPAPVSTPVRRPPASVPTPEPEATGATAPWPVPDHGELRPGALAYADPNAQVAQPRPSAMGSLALRPTAPPDTTVAVKRTGDRPTLISPTPATAAVPPSPAAPKTGDQLNEPWLRVLIVSPSIQSMSASTLGATDYRGFATYLKKPPATVMMTLSDDPRFSMPAGTFTGSAIVFVPTVTFATRTASLR
jgi:uncharacterized protein YcbK (DUF882 family)